MLGNFFKTAAPSAATPGQGKVGAKAGKGGSRLNLKSIPKEAPPAPKKLASIAAGITPGGPKVPSFPFKLGRTKEAKEATARVVNGKLEVRRGNTGRGGSGERVWDDKREVSGRTPRALSLHRGVQGAQI